MTTPSWKVIREAFSEIEAEILKGFLEAQGIETYISQVGYARAMGISVHAGNRIEVLVLDSQFEEASKIMDEYDEGEFVSDDEV